MLRSIKYGLYGLVMAGMVAVPAVWSGVDKTVHLSVDGKVTTFSTTADHVGDLLGDRGFHPSRHDLVAPAVGANVKDGMNVVLRRGRLLMLNVDGQRKDIWTTAPTVAAALQQLGYTADDFVSVSRSRRLPLSPTSIAIRLMRSITVVHDGQTQTVTTTDPTVANLLQDLGIPVASTDRMNVAMTSGLVDGQTIVIERVITKMMTQKVAVKFATQTRSDATMAVGNSEVVTKGRNGSMQLTYQAVFVDGKLVGRTLVRKTVLNAPRAKVVAVGTRKPQPKVEASSTSSGGGSGPAPGGPIPSGNSPSDAKAIAKQMLANRGWGDQFSCLNNIYTRESGWRVHAENSSSGAYGIPQALPGSKMGSAGNDWQDSAATQIRWGLNYIGSRYGDPCGAWNFWQNNGYY